MPSFSPVGVTNTAVDNGYSDASAGDALGVHPIDLGHDMSRVSVDSAVALALCHMGLGRVGGLALAPPDGVG